MVVKIKPSQSLVIVSDDIAHATKVLAEITSVVSAELIAWSAFKPTRVLKFDIIVFDVDLSNPNIVATLKSYYSSSKKRKKIIFAYEKGNRKLEAQYNALGGLNSIFKPLDEKQLMTTILGLGVQIRRKEPGTEAAHNGSVTEKSSDACLEVADLMDSFVAAVRKGQKLPVHDVKASCHSVVETMQNVDMDTWLKTVRAHSSLIYRHVMIVTGFAAAFVNKYNFNSLDKERVTVGALLHDIGKVKIPQKILDKSGKFTKDELERIRRHPIDGANMLHGQKDLSDEVIMIARSHHELLDGSGYPDGLSGDQIPDIVRLVTITDIFADLVEAHPSKKSLSLQEAYDHLVAMGPKLDQDLVRAFEPIALDKESAFLIKVINSTAA